MIVSRLLRTRDKKVELVALLKHLVLIVKENKNQRPVIIFLITLLSSAGVGSYYLGSKIVNDIKDKRDSKPLYKRSSSFILKNGSREFFVSYKSRQKRVIVRPTNPEVYERDKYKFKDYNETFRENKPVPDKDAGAGVKEVRHDNTLNSKFLNQLFIIWQILIPRVNDRNTVLLVAELFFLILRTWLSLLIAKMDGQIVKDIIGGNFKKFLRDLCYWFLMAVPASYTNSAIKYLVKKLSSNFRSNLIRYIHDMYLDSRMVYYKIMFKSESIKDIDNFITTDITRFSNTICSLFSNIGKPMIDLVFFSIYLRDNLGNGGIIGIFINYFISAMILRKYTPSFGSLTKEKSSLEGEYYNDHLNLINNSEEIAFYNGSLIERKKIQSVYSKLMNHIFKVNKIKVMYNVLEDYLLKYTWSALGYLFASIPILITSFNSKARSVSKVKMVSEENNMRQFIVNKRLMLSLADAGSRLMYSIKDVSKLTGYTDRVFTLLNILHQVHSLEFDYDDGHCLKDIQGTIQNNYNGIRFEKVNVIIPSKNGSHGVKLIKDLSLNLKPKESLLILGMNGCGKTSIERVLSGLWPLYDGLISKPNDDDIIYLPQQVYFSKGTFRDQIIYPLSYHDMIELGVDDYQLIRILKQVKLEYLLDREEGLEYFNLVDDWQTVLSGGEKQRMQFARILFKNPKYVILDESTNAISSDIEEYLFDLLKKLNFTFITFSHRPLLIKYHEYLIDIQNNGDWVFEKLGTDSAIISIDKEIKDIENKLSNIEMIKQRKNELQKCLEN